MDTVEQDNKVEKVEAVGDSTQEMNRGPAEKAAGKMRVDAESNEHSTTDCRKPLAQWSTVAVKDTYSKTAEHVPAKEEEPQAHKQQGESEGPAQHCHPLCNPLSRSGQTDT
jgi:FtsZ-interacting cell division protein ZipA